MNFENIDNDTLNDLNTIERIILCVSESVDNEAVKNKLNELKSKM